MEDGYWNEEENREAREAREALQREQFLRLSGTLAELVKTRDGRFFLRWVLQETGAFNANYCMEQPLAAFKEGLRSFGLQLLGLCIKTGCAGELFRMEEEEDAR